MTKRGRKGHARLAPTSDNIAMEIQLNGHKRPLAANSTITALLLAEGLAERRVAVEVNGEIIPRGQHAAHVLQAGDRVEIVHALGGG
jgi:sulfur carrier protein